MLLSKRLSTAHNKELTKEYFHMIRKRKATVYTEVYAGVNATYV